MKTIKNVSSQPTTRTLLADELVEFHAARLLLLFRICGNNGQIDGLTKMAKLDFFVRYPTFFAVVCERLGKEVTNLPGMVESSMVRYHYGPWDHRYYHTLAYLESRGLLSVKKSGNKYQLGLTEFGNSIALRLEKEDTFTQLVNQMRRVKQILGGMKGSRLKNLIYEVFDQQITKLSLDEVIQ